MILGPFQNHTEVLDMSVEDQLERYLKVIFPFKERYVKFGTKIPTYTEDEETGEIIKGDKDEYYFFSLEMSRRNIGIALLATWDKFKKKTPPYIHITTTTEDTETGPVDNKHICKVFAAKYKYGVDKHKKGDANLPFKDLDSGLQSLNDLFKYHAIPPNMYIDNGNEIICLWSTEQNLSTLSVEEYMDLAQAIFFSGLSKEKRSKYSNELMSPMSKLPLLEREYYDGEGKFTQKTHIVDRPELKVAEEAYSLDHIEGRVIEFSNNDISSRLKIKFKMEAYRSQVRKIGKKAIKIIGDSHDLNHPTGIKPYTSLAQKEHWILSLLLNHGFNLDEILHFFETEVPHKEEDAKWYHLKSELEKIAWVREKCNDPNWMPEHYPEMMLARKYAFLTVPKGCKYAEVRPKQLSAWMKAHSFSYYKDFRRDENIVRLWTGQYWTPANEHNVHLYLSDKFGAMGIALDSKAIYEAFKRCKWDQIYYPEIDIIYYKSMIPIPFRNGTLRVYPQHGSTEQRFNHELTESRHARNKTYKRKHGARYALDINYDPSNFDEIETDDGIKYPYMNGFIYKEQLEPLFDEANRKILQMFLGACLVPSLRLDHVLVIMSQGGEGKSTLADTFISMFVKDTGSNVNMKSWNIKFENIEFIESVVNISDEQISYDSDDNIFKQVTGGGFRPIQEKGQPVERARIHAKHIFTVNAVPKGQVQKALRRRFKFIEMKSLPLGKQKTGFKSKYKQHRSELMAFALHGLQMLIENRFEIPDGDDKLTKEWLSQDHYGLFIIDCIEPDLWTNAWISARKLHVAFHRWLDEMQATEYDTRRKKTIPQLSRILKERFSAMTEYEYVQSGVIKNDPETGKQARGFTDIKLVGDWGLTQDEMMAQEREEMEAQIQKASKPKKADNPMEEFIGAEDDSEEVDTNAGMSDNDSE